MDFLHQNLTERVHHVLQETYSDLRIPMIFINYTDAYAKYKNDVE